jgi:hypothetical protein
MISPLVLKVKHSRPAAFAAHRDCLNLCCFPKQYAIKMFYYFIEYQSRKTEHSGFNPRLLPRRLRLFPASFLRLKVASIGKLFYEFCATGANHLGEHRVSGE